MDVDAYLDRIGADPPVELNVSELERLQRAHLTAVPFENLHVFGRRGVSTATDWSIPKIVVDGRGGWCFELNGAFATLLEELGFAVQWLGATVLLGEPSGEPDHLTIRVDLDRPYLVDVGFGDSFMRPLPLDGPGPHDGGRGEYGFIFEDDRATLVFHGDDGVERLYVFGSEPHRSSDFDRASQRLQTQEGLSWTKSRFATRLIDGGPDRVTLLEDRIKFRRGSEWTEEPIAEDAWDEALMQWFSMEP